MLTTFLTTLKVLVRDKSVLLWAIAFPLVLTTLFYAMFSNLDKFYQIDPIPLLVVEDANFDEAPLFAETLEVLASPGTNGDNALLDPTFVASKDAALSALEEGTYKGYVLLDAEGMPQYFMDMRQADSMGNPAQRIIVSVLDRYKQNTELITQLLQDDPSLLANAEFWESLNTSDEDSLTTQISVTANEPSDSMRYFYAVLAFSTIMMTTFALVAVNMALGNTSPLGARRSLGGQSKLKTLVPTIAASWLLAFICVLIGFVYLRFFLGISFGGKEAAVVLIIAASTLASTFLGAFIGSLPISPTVKLGSVSLISCGLSLFAGLYGPQSQDLGDMVARDLPWLSAANPVRQVSEAFFSLYYYDDYLQLTTNLTNILVFCAVFFVLALINLRRQRYASL